MRFWGSVYNGILTASSVATKAHGCLIWLDGLLVGNSTSHCVGEELIAKSFREDGLSFQRSLRGEYSYAIFDESTKTLVLGHDALGLGSIFYRHHASGTSFASHLEDMPRIIKTNEYDEEYVADFIVDGAHYGLRTPYRNQFRVGPGKALILDSNGTSNLISTHIPDEITAPIHFGETAAERLRSLLTAAVRESIPPTGIVISDLSGGLDSTTVSCLASALAPSRVEFLSTIYTRNPRIDEQNWIRVAREDHALPWHTVDASALSPFADLPGLFHAEPSRALLLSAYYRTMDRQLNDRHATAVLTGHGGDGVLFGDSPEPFFMADLALRAPRELMYAMRLWQRGSRQHRPPSYWFTKYVAAPWLRRVSGRRMIVAPHLCPVPSWLDRGFARDMKLSRRAETSIVGGDHSIAGAYYWERIRRSVTSLAVNLYRRPNAPAYRSPLLALPIVEFMATLPWHLQVQPDRDRPLQRDALIGILPERIRLRRGKRSSDGVFHDGMSRSPQWIDYLCDAPIVAERGYVDRDAWRAEVTKFKLGFTENISVFLNVCALEAWLKLSATRL